MAVGAHTVILIAQPAALLDRSLDSLDDVLAHLVSALQLLRTQQNIAGQTVTGGQHLVNHIHGLSEHGGGHSVQSQGLPVEAGTAVGDQAGHSMGILSHITDLNAESQLIGQEALGELQVQGAGGQIVRGNSDDDALAGLHLVDDLIHIVLILQDAAVILVLLTHLDLTHLNGAALAAGAVLDVIVEQVDHLDLSAALLASQQSFLQQSLRVAAVTTGTDTQNLHKQILHVFFMV